MNGESQRDETYRIPKFQAPARVLLPGSEPVDVTLYLSDHAERRSGRERPSDLLNGGKEFLPAEVEDRGVGLIRREAVIVLEVDAEVELGEDYYPPDVLPPDAARRQEVMAFLQDGSRISGNVTYYRPVGQQRLQDFLNSAEQFFPVRDGDVIQLVNKDRIAWVGPA